ncbi:MAG: hypothetical protein R6U69_03800 [Marinobacter sp.]|uniref:hypothetical protein n=1 Tax=Marinobacter sp. TaxID=50741 RepID=UPI00356A843F
MLAEINDGAERHEGKTRGNSGNANGDAKEHGNKDGAVLGEINGDARKDKR